MEIVYMEPPTKEEMEEYKRLRHKEFLKSYENAEKMRGMKPKAVGKIGKIIYGICPRCGHCLIENDNICEECFQRIDWRDGN